MAEIDSLEIKIESDAAKANQAIKSIIDNLGNLSKSLNVDTSKLANIGKSINVSGITSAAKNIQSQAKEITKSASKINTELGKGFQFHGSLSGLEKQIDKYKNNLETAKVKVQELRSAGKMDTDGYTQAINKVLEYRNIVESLEKQLAEIQSVKPTVDFKINGMETAKSQISDISEKLRTVSIPQSAFNYNADAMKAVFGEAAAGIENWTQATKRFGENAGDILNKTVVETDALKAKTGQFEQSLKNLKIPPINTENISVLQRELAKAEAEIEKLRAKLANGITMGRISSNVDDKGFRNLQEQIALAEKKAEALRKKIKEVGDTSGKENVGKLGKGLSDLSTNGAKAGSALKKVSNSILNLSGRASGALNPINKMSNSFKGLFRTLLPILGIRQLFNWGKQSIEIASDLTEVQNVVDTTFGNMAYKVEDFAKTSIEQFGMSELALKQYSSRFQAMGTAMGFPIGQMSDMSIELTKLTADMASFYNVEQKAVAEDLESIFTGQTRPLRTYGLDLTQATLQEWALKQGMDANIQSMSQMEKTLLRYQYVLANTGASQGDFVRTANTWANQVRILRQNFEQLGAVLGNVFINALKPLVKGLNNAMSHIIAFAKTISNALGKIFGWTFEESGGGIATDMEDASDMIGDASNGAGDLADNLGKAENNAKKLKTIALGIDELNINAPDEDYGVGIGGGIGGAGVGAGGNIGESIANALGGQWVQGGSILKKFESEIDSLYELGKYIGDTLARALSSIQWAKVYEGARNFGKGLAEFLNGLISPELFYNLGKTVANSINTAFHAANAFAIEFDWDNLGKSLAQSIKGFFKNWDAGLTAETLSNFAKGILRAATAAINELRKSKVFEDIGQKLVDFLCGIDWIGLAWELGKFFLALQNALIDFPNDFAKGVGQAIIDKIFGEDSGIKMPEITLPLTSLLGLQAQFRNIREWAVETAIVIKSRFEEGWNATKNAWENGSSFFGGIWAGIKTIFSPVIEFFSERFTGAYEAVKSAFSFISTWFKEKWDAVKRVFKDVVSFFKEKFTSAYNAIKAAFSQISTWFREKWDAVKRVFGGVGEFFGDAFGRGYQAIKDAFSDIGTFFKGIANKIIDPIEDAINGVIKGVNWVLDKLGSGKQLSLWAAPEFAKGTNGLPKDTMGIVNDQKGSVYKELIVPPHGKPFIPEGRNVMLPLEKGTKIMPAHQTKELMSMNGIPRFAGGIGKFFNNAWESISKFTGDVMDYFESPGKLVQIAFDKFIDISRWTGVIGDIGAGAISTIFDSAVEFIKKFFGSSSIEKALEWAVGIANDERHGYDQAHRTGPDYDCSSLVTIALKKAGLDVPLGTTSTMLGQLKSVGFKNVTGTVNLSNSSGMRRGDVLLTPGKHTAMYLGNGKIVHASINEFGGIRGGKTGDQTGREIEVARYHNHPWEYVLRYSKAFKNGIGSISMSDIIPRYKSGGFPEDGLFYKNHNEIITQVGGRTQVLNSADTYEMIKQAAYEGQMQAQNELIGYLSDIAKNTRETADKNMSVKLDTRTLVNECERRKSRNGFSFLPAT